MTKTEMRWRSAILPPDATLAQAIENLNTSGMRLILCIGYDGNLCGTVSDGDLRRGLLRGLGMNDPIKDILNSNPLVVPEDTDPASVKALMQANKIMQIPVVDITGDVTGLHLWDEIGTMRIHNHTMIIMAGGKGTRLRPYTENCPKPMLAIAGKPMLQHIIERAKLQGFQNFILSLNYLGTMIRDHFADGDEYGVQISYVNEDEPLGTAGALSLLNPRPDTAFVVTNGDVLTDIDYYKLIKFCERNDAHAVMAVRSHEWINPYGVVEMDGLDITGFAEKPISRSHINAGIYAFLPKVLEQLAPDNHCDMPTLFNRLRAAGLRTIVYPMYEPWLDVGSPNDLESAQESLLQPSDTKS